MARGGINKALVQKAYEAVLAKGQNPSIDAVRVALGNTGSKSTIHRYLKELEEEASTRLDDEALLSDPIKDLIKRLASRLHDEAQGIVTEADERHSKKLLEWKSQYDSKTKALADTEEQISQLSTELETSQLSNKALTEEVQSLTAETHRWEQKISDLETLVEEKDRHVASLEEKHTHSREALVHYRESVKEQREQDVRKHEQQVQQLQAETRQLNQTLSIKQTDITQLNKDNSRLVTELSATQKSFLRVESVLESSENQRSSLKEEALLLAEKLRISQINEVDAKEVSEALRAEHDKLNTENQAFKIRIAKLESVVEVKNELINHMMPSETETNSSKPGHSKKEV